MFHIVTRLNLQTLLIDIVGCFNSEQQAINHLFNIFTDNEDKKIYIQKIENKKFIKVYEVHQGFIYDSKYLKYIYEIKNFNEYKEKTYKDKKEKDKKKNICY